MSREPQTYLSGADLSADAGRVMRATSASGGLGVVQRATSAALGGATQALVGILESNATSSATGLAVAVAHPGCIVEHALAGGTITAGVDHELTCDATGRLVPAVAGQKYIALNQHHRTVTVGQRLRVQVWYGLTDAGGGSI